jgi:hypothetical protein
MQLFAFNIVPYEKWLRIRMNGFITQRSLMFTKVPKPSCHNTKKEKVCVAEREIEWWFY